MNDTGHVAANNDNTVVYNDQLYFEKPIQEKNSKDISKFWIQFLQVLHFIKDSYTTWGGVLDLEVWFTSIINR